MFCACKLSFSILVSRKSGHVNVLTILKRHALIDTVNICQTLHKTSKKMCYPVIFQKDLCLFTLLYL